MKKIIGFILFALAVTTLVFCGAKSEGKKALAEMEKIVAKIEKDKGSLTAEEWNNLAVQFSEYGRIANKSVEENKFEQTDRTRLIALTTRWATASSDEMSRDFSSILNQVPQYGSTHSDSMAVPGDDNKRWIVHYKNIILGNQGNNTNGHFLKLKTGETVKVDDVAGQEEYLALMVFTEYRGTNMFVTFPANAEEVSALKEFDENRLFSQNPGGLRYWPSDKRVSGMFRYTTEMDIPEFNEILNSENPAHFDKTFRKFNGGNENLRGRMAYDINMSAGKIYLVQFNGLIRGIMLVNKVKTGDCASLAFDLIVEGRQDFADVGMAKYLQPDEFH